MVKKINLNSLTKLCDPFSAWTPWNNPILPCEIEKAVKETRFYPPDEDTNDYDKNRNEHIERIAWFVKFGWSDPIVVDTHPRSDHAILDGNHRACAALLRGDKTILARSPRTSSRQYTEQNYINNKNI